MLEYLNKIVQFLQRITLFKTWRVVMVNNVPTSSIEEDIEKLDLLFLEEIQDAKDKNKSIVEAAEVSYRRATSHARTVYYESLAKAQETYRQLENQAFKDYLATKKVTSDNYNKAVTDINAAFDLSVTPASEQLKQEVNDAEELFNLDIAPIKNKYNAIKQSLLDQKEVK
jgi:hypothetical protein